MSANRLNFIKEDEILQFLRDPAKLQFHERKMFVDTESASSEPYNKHRHEYMVRTTRSWPIGRLLPLVEALDDTHLRFNARQAEELRGSWKKNAELAFYLRVGVYHLNDIFLMSRGVRRKRLFASLTS